MLAAVDHGLRSVASLRANPINPRGEVPPDTVMELVESIKSQGVLQPLLITPDGTVVAGHRRLMAARIAGLESVPVVVRDLDQSEQLAAMLTENLQRADLNPIQEAISYQRLKALGMSQADITRRVGVCGARITERLQLLRLDSHVQAMFASGELPVTLGRVLSGVTDVRQQRRLALMSARRRLSVARLESIVDKELAPKASEPRSRKSALHGSSGDALPTWVGRRRAIDVLAGSRQRKVTFGQLEEQFDTMCGICSECGMSSMEVICQECPLPQFVLRLAGA